jgi:hypothetical protein
MAIWQELVSDYGFPQGYQSVKRFVLKLADPSCPKRWGSSRPPPQKKPRSITDRARWCAIRRAESTDGRDCSCRPFQVSGKRVSQE